MSEPDAQGVDEQTVADILEREWDMFQGVRGLDGPAPCQQDRRTFDIMRASQVRVWTQAIADSYLEDLRRAQAADRNLMTEKYARMMESTSPCECRGIGAVLPKLEPETIEVLDSLMRRSMRWRETVEATYPNLSGRGRPIRAWDDDRFTTSFETYLRSELATYGDGTLRLLDDQYAALQAAGQNPAEMILRETMERYGFTSLDEAESAVKAHHEKRGTGRA
jgi:hypothetical protein